MQEVDMFVPSLIAFALLFFSVAIVLTITYLDLFVTSRGSEKVTDRYPILFKIRSFFLKVLFVDFIVVSGIIVLLMLGWKF